MKTLMDYAQKVAAGEATPVPQAGDVPAPAPKQQQEVIHEVLKHVAVMNYQTQIQGELNKAEFKLLSQYPNAAQEVYSFAAKYAAAKGQTLTPTDAARIMQDEYREYLKATYSQDAIREALGIPAAPIAAPTAPTKAPPVARSTQPQTITNAAASQPAAPPNWGSLSEEAKIAAIVKQLPSDLW
jgi:hypothetical protein